MTLIYIIMSAPNVSKEDHSSFDLLNVRVLWIYKHLEEVPGHAIGSLLNR